MSTKKAGLKVLVLLVVLLFIVGVILLVVAHYNSQHALTHDISRDIGIAFLISALVTLAYEAYARTRFDLEKIESLLDTLYGSGLPAGIWESIKETLLKRELIRRNSVLDVRVLRDPSVGEDNVVLDIDLTYDLANLLSKDKVYTVLHGLDEHIAAAKLPRFIGASIGNRYETITNNMSWQTKDGVMTVHNGRLSLTVDLPAASEKGAIPLTIKRQEVRSCPGSYYLIMTELTEGFRINLRDGADDVNVTVALRPSERVIDLTKKRIEIINEPLLPGHCLEFKLTVQPTSQPQPATP